MKRWQVLVSVCLLVAVIARGASCDSGDSAVWPYGGLTLDGGAVSVAASRGPTKAPASGLVVEILGKNYDPVTFIAAPSNGTAYSYAASTSAFAPGLTADMAMSFRNTGDDDCITTMSPPSLSYPFTWVMKVRIVGTGGDAAAAAWGTATSYANYATFYTYPTKMMWHPGQYSATWTSDLGPNVYAVCKTATNTVKFFKNGVQQGPTYAYGDGPDSQVRHHIGAVVVSNVPYCLNGDIFSFRWYSRELSAAEHAASVNWE
jgi:hypothetical protein